MLCNFASEIGKFAVALHSQPLNAPEPECLQIQTHSLANKYELITIYFSMLNRNRDIS